MEKLSSTPGYARIRQLALSPVQWSCCSSDFDVNQFFSVQMKSQKESVASASASSAGQLPLTSPTSIPIPIPSTPLTNRHLLRDKLRLSPSEAGQQVSR